MLIVCKTCASSYHIPREILGENGCQLRCVGCGETVGGSPRRARRQRADRRRSAPAPERARSASGLFRGSAQKPVASRSVEIGISFGVPPRRAPAPSARRRAVAVGCDRRLRDDGGGVAQAGRQSRPRRARGSSRRSACRSICAVWRLTTCIRIFSISAIGKCSSSKAPS